MSRFPSGWKSRGDSWGVGYGRPRHRPVFAHGGVRSRGVRHHSGRRCWPYIQAHQQVHDVAGSRGRLVATRCDKLRRAGSLSAGDSFAPAAVLALPFPNDSFHFDDFLEMDGVVELDGAREMGTEVLRRVSGGKAMPGEMGYGMGRTSEAGGGGWEAPEVRDVREISRARACDACARVSRVTSWGDAGLVGDIADVEPLPFLAPRLRRLCVDAEREPASPSTSPSCSCWS